MTTSEGEPVRTNYIPHYIVANFCVPSTAGDARNEVMTGSTMHKLGYNPEVYRLNALQNLAYDPSRKTHAISVTSVSIIIIFLCVGPVPKQVDLNHMVRMETARKQEHAQTHMRQRRMSDSMVSQCVW